MYCYIRFLEDTYQIAWRSSTVPRSSSLHHLHFKRTMRSVSTTRLHLRPFTPLRSELVPHLISYVRPQRRRPRTSLTFAAQNVCLARLQQQSRLQPGLTQRHLLHTCHPHVSLLLPPFSLLLLSLSHHLRHPALSHPTHHIRLLPSTASALFLSVPLLQ